MHRNMALVVSVQADSSHADVLRSATILVEAVAGRRSELCGRAVARRRHVMRNERPLVDCRSSGAV